MSHVLDLTLNGQWHAGYERCGRVREAFRLPTSLAPCPLQPWPCCRLRSAWFSLLHLLQLVCHRALTLTLGRPVLGAPPKTKSRLRYAQTRESTADGAVQEGRSSGTRNSAFPNGRMRSDGEGNIEEGGKVHCVEEEGGHKACAVCRGRSREPGITGFDVAGGFCGGCVTGRGGGLTACDGAERAVGRCCMSCRYCATDTTDNGDLSRSHVDDFSVSYALRYPNDCADPGLEEEDLTVGEHVDPSLFVAEPCCGVEGLEIQDRHSGR